MGDSLDRRLGELAASKDDLSRYLVDRVKLLEERNNLLREQNSRIESEKRFAEGQKLKYEREVRQLRSELERLKTSPLVVGSIVEVLKNGKAIIRSSSGPQFVVGVSKMIKKSDLVPGASVALNYQTLAVVEVLPTSRDPFVSGMEVMESTDVSYQDIGGLDEQIKELRETVELPLTNPGLFEKIGIEPPKGVLLYGPPGTGKTLLAKAVAHETRAAFIRIVGSELVQKYIGEGARIVRELFKMARDKAPSIIFIDELDTIGAKRMPGLTSGDREVHRTLMQLLAEMDGFNARGNVRIIGATNRPDILDSALVRPGRFDRLVEIPPPSREGRAAILRIHTRNMNLSRDVDLEKLAAITDGATGADLKALATEAGMFAVRSQREAVEMEDFLEAKKKIFSTENKTFQGSMFG